MACFFSSFAKETSLFICTRICINSFGVYMVKKSFAFAILSVWLTSCLSLHSQTLFLQPFNGFDSGSSSDVVWFHSENDRYLNLSRLYNVVSFLFIALCIGLIYTYIYIYICVWCANNSSVHFVCHLFYIMLH